MEEQLDGDLEIEKELFDTADKIKEYTTESAGDKLTMELEDLESIKQSVKTEISNRIEHLTHEYQRWKTFNETREQFEQWLKATEKELKNLSATSIDLDTPIRFQVV